ncbi:hypothetical protein QWY85_08095 [Neolewinella lacunae]|uniref:Periplasmic heavy metal sensor n=1 Tax=Neolewinella lacunae TaxID=1517758 RepID=A0A923TCY1_9BACT|nr:hypothetical protein [Neolewinella lacunae]MBC6994227.1 hypothetical protein [Neolewinella lacunae]MDN3634614.1 hypothetical protein [Neolewinella lacunae]
MKKYCFLFALLLVFTLGNLAAQRQPGAPPTRLEQAQNRIHLARQAFITEKLGLTPTEVKAFFPLFWAYESRIRELKREEGWRKLREPGGSTLTEAEALQHLRDERLRRQQLTKLMEEAEDKFLTVLPATKVVRLEEVEKAFRQQLWERTREWRRNNGH